MKKILKRLINNLRFNLSASNNFIFIGFYKYFYRPNKGSMSDLLSQYSKTIGPEFTVVQIGANDGITQDPINKFIKRDRWSGVLLEPQKYVFDSFLTRTYAQHQNIKLINAAIGERDEVSVIYKIGFSNSRWATGLTTFNKPTLVKAFDTGHVARNCAKEGISIPEDPAQRIVEEEVQVISSAGILKNVSGNKDIDLLMIDAEGFDYEVIKLFNIETTQPGLIIFEHGHLSDSDYSSCTDLLATNNYIFRKDGPNTVAIKKGRNLYPNYFK